ncbi:MAG: site-specific DNA-methyltransferase [Planctomycetes bacterium UTPLA1]|jgi:adenine-specific DNA-methyltransferase|nr:MAG: site-specific DNA-methyltransferase [Planctomycetes bacterium UTPLA1]
MQRKQKLELTWIGKDERPKLEPRILLEDPAKSYHAARRVKPDAKPGEPGYPGDLFDNRLIFGDNLLALKAIETEFTGKIKCIYIDPPYNTGSAFEHYDDGIEHSLWLSLMRDRLEILRRLLHPTGSIWVNLDDNEAHYAKVLLDELFERRNFVANVLWQKRTSPDARIHLGAAHDHILVYARDREQAFFHEQALTPAQRELYKNPDNDPRGPWASADFTAQGWRPNQMYKITTPGGTVYEPQPGRCWAQIESEFLRLKAEKRLWFGKDGNARPRVKNFLSDATGVKSWSWWTNQEVGHNQDAKAESIGIFGRDNSFATPKPEALLQRIVEISTSPGEWVLDSFAGSGTTGAVAHKMGRRWIMVELGEHCHTHILPRLKKVVDGDDKGGVTEPTGWKGGGGFRYYRLAPSLLEKDRWGNWVISKEFNAAMLAEALCKLEGFTYAPSDSLYWQHGHSTERDFIYVTTQPLTRDMLAKLSDEVGEDRTLLALCKSFTGRASFPNLTIKKIPKAVMSKCEWGRDDYSMEIKSLPPPLDDADDTEEARLGGRGKAKVLRGSRKPKDDGPGLFDAAPAGSGTRGKTSTAKAKTGKGARR